MIYHRAEQFFGRRGHLITDRNIVARYMEISSMTAIPSSHCKKNQIMTELDNIILADNEKY
jgi:hypothetical protein